MRGTIGSVTYLSQESRRGISSLGVKLGRWFKSLASLLRGCEPPMLLALSLPLLVECSLENSLLAGPESETRRSVTKEIRHEELRIGRVINDPRLPRSQYQRKIHPVTPSATPSHNYLRVTKRTKLLFGKAFSQCDQISLTSDNSRN